MILDMTNKPWSWRLPYVYAHYRLDTGELVYVGKGVQYRMSSLAGRNKRWHQLRLIHGLVWKIEARFETEQAALEYEKDLIAQYKPEANISNGGHKYATYGFKGKRHTDERNRKLSERMKGKLARPITEEDVCRILACSDQKKKEVLDLETGVVYRGIRVCSRAIGVWHSRIKAMADRNQRFVYL